MEPTFASASAFGSLHPIEVAGAHGDTLAAGATSAGTRGDEQIPFGLHLIAGIFNANGWYWGAGFATEDAHHFEAGSALIQTW